MSTDLTKVIEMSRPTPDNPIWISSTLIKSGPGELVDVLELKPSERPLDVTLPKPALLVGRGEKPLTRLWKKLSGSSGKVKGDK